MQLIRAVELMLFIMKDRKLIFLAADNNSLQSNFLGVLLSDAEMFHWFFSFDSWFSSLHAMQFPKSLNSWR